MTKDQKQQVLDALQVLWRDVSMNDYAFEKLEQAIAIMQQAVDAPDVEAEPIQVTAVGEVVETDDGLEVRSLLEGGWSELAEGMVIYTSDQPLTDDDGQGVAYAAPQERKPLSDDFLIALENDVAREVGNRRELTIAFARAIEEAVWRNL